VFERLVVKPLPFQVPTVHVDMVWRKRLRQPHAHQWLRQAVARASQQTLAKIKA
jgi:DNA-binding transcriptional LysR family regulator